MGNRRLHAPGDAPQGLREGFARIRADLGIPEAFPAAVTDEADAAARSGPHEAPRDDARDLPFVTIDPPGSRDLDQALWIQRDGTGFVLHYAIADLSAWIAPGGAVEAEAWRRGETMYSPDLRTPLYPPVLSEGAASLLPDGDRPAVVFRIPVSAEGAAGVPAVRRAVVRSRRRLAYAEADEHTVPNLEAAGGALAAAAAARGATQIDMPGQEIVPADAPPGFALHLEDRLLQEDWNAQISLCANIAAAGVMLAAGVGLFRVLGPADPSRAAGLRAAAVTLGLVPADVPDPLRAVVAATGDAPTALQLRRHARAVSHGAGYVALPGAAQPPWHSAVASAYAHATAPLRRLADRYVLDLSVALTGGLPVPEGTAAVMSRLAEVMNRAEASADRLDSLSIDLVEATLLHGREGQRFDAVVTGTHPGGVSVQLRDPPVRASIRADGLRPGDEVQVVLDDADSARGSVRFSRR